MKPITKEDLLQYKFLSAVRYAPGGARAAFVVASSNEEENCYERRLWLNENGALRQLTDLGREGSFLWLDENRLIFPAVRSAKEKKRAEAKEEFTSYYVLDVRGGEALPYMTLPFAVGSIRLLGGNASLSPPRWTRTGPCSTLPPRRRRPPPARRGRRNGITRFSPSCPSGRTGRA